MRGAHCDAHVVVVDLAIDRRRAADRDVGVAVVGLVARREAADGNALGRDGKRPRAVRELCGSRVVGTCGHVDLHRVRTGILRRGNLGTVGVVILECGRSHALVGVIICDLDGGRFGIPVIGEFRGQRHREHARRWGCRPNGQRAILVRDGICIVGGHVVAALVDHRHLTRRDGAIRRDVVRAVRVEGEGDRRDGVALPQVGGLNPIRPRAQRLADLYVLVLRLDGQRASRDVCPRARLASRLIDLIVRSIIARERRREGNLLVVPHVRVGELRVSDFAHLHVIVSHHFEYYGMRCVKRCRRSAVVLLVGGRDARDPNGLGRDAGRSRALFLLVFRQHVVARVLARKRVAAELHGLAFARGPVFEGCRLACGDKLDTIATHDTVKARIVTFRELRVRVAVVDLVLHGCPRDGGRLRANRERFRHVARVPTRALNQHVVSARVFDALRTLRRIYRVVSVLRELRFVVVCNDEV